MARISEKAYLLILCGPVQHAAVGVVTGSCFVAAAQKIGKEVGHIIDPDRGIHAPYAELLKKKKSSPELRLQEIPLINSKRSMPKNYR